MLATTDGRGGSNRSRWFDEFELRRSRDDGVGDVALAEDGLGVGLEKKVEGRRERVSVLGADAKSRKK